MFVATSWIADEIMHPSKRSPTSRKRPMMYEADTMLSFMMAPSVS